MKLSILKGKRKQIQRVIALVFISVICLVSVISVAALSKTVYITVGEESIKINTINTDTYDILSKAGIEVEEDDKVTRIDGENDISIEVNRAIYITVNVDNETKNIVMHEGTVADALEKAEVILSDIDTVEPALDTILTGGEIKVTRWYNISFSDNGVEENVKVPEGTVKSTLEYLECDEIDNDDILYNELSDVITEDTAIVIDRVEYNEVTKTESIPYKKTTQNTDSLYKGQTNLLVEGVNGERELLIREKSVNGEITETEVLSTTVLKEATDELTLIGTKAQTVTIPLSSKYSYTVTEGSGTFIDHNGNTVSYSKVLSGSCTAYHEPAGSLTSTGRTVAMGYVAVNPNVIPYGTRMYVVSPNGGFVYGYAIAADTGGALMQGLGLLDLYFDSDAGVDNFGRRTMIVYILD